MDLDEVEKWLCSPQKHSCARKKRAGSQDGRGGKEKGKSIKKINHSNIRIKCKKMHCTCLYLLQIIQNIRQVSVWRNTEYLHRVIPHVIRPIIEFISSRIKFTTFLLDGF